MTIERDWLKRLNKLTFKIKIQQNKFNHFNNSKKQKKNNQEIKELFYKGLINKNKKFKN